MVGRTDIVTDREQQTVRRQQTDGCVYNRIKDFGRVGYYIAKDGKEADCKRMFAVMGLGVKNGQEVVFTFDGEDEDAACEAVSKFMKENL